MSFISKILDKILLVQLNFLLLFFKVFSSTFLQQISTGFQSWSYSTQSASLRVSNNVALNVDSGSHVVLLMLDLSAAFDMVEHDIPIVHPRDKVGI